ncbi:MAG: 2-hydroxyglutaryl-CoA dehydratase [Bacillota bacterium]|jgi:predicted nucleotide-binding protein (sugar kinase/HSP70/actin superfamily)
MTATIPRIEFTKEMRETYTILAPNMVDIHFRILVSVFKSFGYNLELLSNTSDAMIDEGLQFVHNDTCYPALVTIGQMLDALKSGKYDVNKTALLMTQTGGGCRASNYIHLLRKALVNAGYPNVPVISLGLVPGMEKNSGFKITAGFLRRALATLAYGDILMLLNNQVKPYEINKGESAELVQKWVEFLSKKFANKEAYTQKEMKHYFKEIVEDFAAIEIKRTPKVKVGIVGEIFVKYSPYANNNLEDFLAKQDCEVMVPGLLSFMFYCVDNMIQDINLYGGSKIKRNMIIMLTNYLTKYETFLIEAVNKYSDFIAPSTFAHLKELAEPLIGVGCKMGEGWMLTAEMLELNEHGYGNIVCAQPFGCLPNHIVGKGMVRKLINLHPEMNIVSLDYDPGMTKVNQENRIKLMLAIAKEKMQ